MPAKDEKTIVDFEPENPRTSDEPKFHTRRARASSTCTSALRDIKHVPIGFKTKGNERKSFANPGSYSKGRTGETSKREREHDTCESTKTRVQLAIQKQHAAILLVEISLHVK